LLKEGEEEEGEGGGFLFDIEWDETNQKRCAADQHFFLLALYGGFHPLSFWLPAASDEDGANDGTFVVSSV